jgi:hypothetical protein
MRGFRWLESEGNLLMVLFGAFVLAMLIMVGAAYLL